MVSKKRFGQPEMTPCFNNKFFLKRKRVDIELIIQQEENLEEVLEEMKNMLRIGIIIGKKRRFKKKEKMHRM